MITNTDYAENIAECKYIEVVFLFKLNNLDKFKSNNDFFKFFDYFVAIMGAWNFRMFHFQVLTVGKVS